MPEEDIDKIVLDIYFKFNNTFDYPSNIMQNLTLMLSTFIIIHVSISNTYFNVVLVKYLSSLVKQCIPL